jgi:hypothetical protein
MTSGAHRLRRQTPRCSTAACMTMTVSAAIGR